MLAFIAFGATFALIYSADLYSGLTTGGTVAASLILVASALLAGALQEQSEEASVHGRDRLWHLASPSTVVLAIAVLVWLSLGIALARLAGLNQGIIFGSTGALISLTVRARRSLPPSRSN